MDFDTEQTLAVIKKFIGEKLSESGLGGYVVGLSGGIDSAVSATLAVRAVGTAKVLAVMIPYRTSTRESVTHARELAQKIGIEHREIDITPMIDAYFPSITDYNRLRAGNKMARERMSILFDIANELDRLVLGTGNRTEICLGYTTWYGDAACSLDPLGELYKTEIRQLASRLDVPEVIISKAPSADLWVGQTDEEDIGVTYERIDRLLQLIIDEGITSMSTLKDEGCRPDDINRVVSLMNRNAFKRRLPDIACFGRKPIPANIMLQE
ncbi:MAG: NAD+ synthase [candidate division Zixibacteria bacterium]|nr:NAD+ synthase [candidate division Zixibacteria bacterium]